MRKKAIIAALTAAVLTAMSIVPAFAAETATPVAGSQNGAAVTTPVGWEANAIDGYDDSKKEHHPAYIKGYTDGTIKPWKKLKRAEAVQMLHNINSANPAPTEKFYESPQITRGEFAKLVLAAKGVKAKKLSDVLTGYPDAQARKYSYPRSGGNYDKQSVWPHSRFIFYNGKHESAYNAGRSNILLGVLRPHGGHNGPQHIR